MMIESVKYGDLLVLLGCMMFQFKAILFLKQEVFFFVLKTLNENGGCEFSVTFLSWKFFHKNYRGSKLLLNDWLRCGTSYSYLLLLFHTLYTYIVPIHMLAFYGLLKNIFRQVPADIQKSNFSVQHSFQFHPVYCLRFLHWCFKQTGRCWNI